MINPTIVPVQLLHSLRKSVATLQISGDWGAGNGEDNDATLELSTDCIWMQGRAPQKRLSLLQARLLPVT